MRPTVWTVSAVEADRHFEWRAKPPEIELVADHSIESRGPDAARVRLRFEFKGLAGVLLGFVFGALTRRAQRDAQPRAGRVSGAVPDAPARRFGRDCRRHAAGGSAPRGGNDVGDAQGGSALRRAVHERPRLFGRPIDAEDKS
jgi:hypothetical protein